MSPHYIARKFTPLAKTMKTREKESEKMTMTIETLRVHRATPEIPTTLTL